MEIRWYKEVPFFTDNPNVKLNWKLLMKPLFCSDPLQRFACDGLRTLVLGTKDLSEGEYESWKRSHAEAANCIEDREERLDAVYDQIEMRTLFCYISAHFCSMYLFKSSI